jgi:hypothetical protein
MGKRGLCAVAAALAGFLGLLAVACVGDEPGPSNAATGDGGGGPDAAEASTSAEAAGGDYSIHCESQQCQGSDVCCVVSSGGNYVSASCKAKAACASTYLECDSTHECGAGLVCCANTNGGSYNWASSSCKALCAGSERKLCDDPSECDGGCQPNVPSISPPNLRACAL